MEFDIPNRGVRRIMENDLELRSYKIVIELLLYDDQKLKRKKSASRVWTNFRKEDTIRNLFSDEKFFDIGSVYNSQNDRMWAVNRADANKKRYYLTEIKLFTESNGLVGRLFQRRKAIADFGWRNS